MTKTKKIRSARGENKYEFSQLNKEQFALFSGAILALEGFKIDIASFRDTDFRILTPSGNCGIVRIIHSKFTNFPLSIITKAAKKLSKISSISKEIEVILIFSFNLSKEMEAIFEVETPGYRLLDQLSLSFLSSKHFIDEEFRMLRELVNAQNSVNSRLKTIISLSELFTPSIT
jgi:hypothetical protein